MKPRKIPRRTCIGCREVKPKRELLRIVRTAEGVIIADPSGKINGRGAYICAKQQCLKTAFTSKRLAKALDTEISAADLSRVKDELDIVIKTSNKTGF